MVEGGGEDKTSVRARAVFISYASQDAEAAGRICEALRAAGIEVWFDQSELRGGDAWDQSIRRQIKTCGLFLPLISRNTHDRVEGYFRLEWKLAVDRSHLMAADQAFLLPVVIDGTRDDDERVPERFREVQWTRLPGGVTPAAFVERVRRLLSGELSQEPTRTVSAAARAAAPPSTGQPSFGSWRSKAALLAAIAVVVVVLGYLVANRLVLSRHSAEVGAAPAPAAQSAPATAFDPPPHSIAVLPFSNLSGDAKQEYFSDGLSEELINALSNIDSLRVIARTTTFSFKGRDLDVGAIARKLNVAAVLEGSVRRSGSTVRITAELIDGTNGFHLWSQAYNRELRDVLQLQTDIATSVAQQLRARLAPTEPDKIQAGGTHIPEAYDAYLRAQQLATAADTGAEYKTALQAADQAIALDPGYAAAYALRAHLLRDTTFAESDPAKRRKIFGLARQAAERAVALAPNFADGHLILGWHVLAHGFLDLRGAAREIERGVELAPGSAAAQDYFAGLELLLDHRDSAVTAMRRAVSLDPQNYKYRFHMVTTFYFARRFADVASAARDADALKRGSHPVANFLVLSYLAQGQPDRARQTCESPATPLDEDDRHFCLTLAYAALGDVHRADIELVRFKALNGTDAAAAFEYAAIYAQRGAPRSALGWLAKAEAAREPSLTTLKTEWLLDPIRSTPEFRALERRLNFPP
jgi:TolB-like protein